MTAAAAAPARPLSRRELTTLALASLGGALEYYDFIIFVFLVTVLSGLFFPPEIPDWLRDLQTLGIFAVGYFARPVGGIVLAHFGDMFGRKRVFLFTVFVMTAATFGIALLPTYAAIGYAAPILLLLLRLLQGASVGGEVPGSYVFTAEHVSDRHTGRAMGILVAGISLGVLLGSLVATALNAIYTPEEVRAFAWRIPFLVGGVFGLVAIWLRRYLAETPVFEELRARKLLSRTLPVKRVIVSHMRESVLAFVVVFQLASMIAILLLVTPSILQKTYGFTALEALQANSFAIFMQIIGCLIWGIVLDRIGIGRFYIVAMACLGASSFAFYTLLIPHPELLLPLYGLVGLSLGLTCGVPYVLVRSFPADIRFSGVSLSYNIGQAVFGGLTPVLIVSLMRVEPRAPAFYMLAVAATGIATGIYLLKRKL